MKEETWVTTPNPWWRFLVDRLVVLIPLVISSGLSTTKSRVPTSDRSLAEPKAMWTQPIITERKILQNRPIECLMMGNLHRVKLMQFAKLEINMTMLIKAS